METWLTNPLEDVFRTTKKPNLGYYNRIPEPGISMARNARESLQLAVDVQETPMANAYVEIIPSYGDAYKCGIDFECGGVQLIHNSFNSINIGEKIIRAKLPGELPEGIIPKPKNIPYRQTASFFITAVTTESTKPGKYNFIARLHYQTGRSLKNETVDHPFYAEVFPVCLPDAGKSDYANETWVNFCGYAPETNFIKMVESNADTYGIETFSDNWFRLIENYAVMMKKERINVVMVPWFTLLARDIKFDSDNNYIFDFTLFDRFIDVFLKTGCVKYFSGFHMTQKSGIMLGMEPGQAKFELVTPVFKPGAAYYDFDFEYLNAPGSWKHFEMLIKPLYAHLKKRGIAEMWLQHVSDEVAGEDCLAAVRKLYRLIHTLAPEFTTIDANWEGALAAYGNDLNIHVPQIDIYDLKMEAYDEARKKNNIELWSYTCLKPQFNYLSRLDDWKLISTRLIHWFNFQHHLKGYLHWSWNLWHYGNPFEDGCCNGWPLDGWAVLPDTKNLDVYETIRQRANASGIEDLELLSICDKIDHEKTQTLLSVLISRANDYSIDTNQFFRVRRMLLELASGM